MVAIVEATEMYIEEHNLPYSSRKTYTVHFGGNAIFTLVTADPNIVTNWISSLSASRNVVGLDIEWRPNLSRQSDNPAATLQLCVGNTCLIFQILHAPSIPQSLTNFLSNRNNVFVGVGIAADVEKLWYDYNLRVANAVDPRVNAVQLGYPMLRNAGLKECAWVLLGFRFRKPKGVTMSLISGCVMIRYNMLALMHLFLVRLLLHCKFESLNGNWGFRVLIVA